MARRRVAILALKVVVTLSALAWAASRLSFADLEAAFGRVSPLALVASIALLFGNVGVGAARWRTLVAAYTSPPRWPAACHAYLVAGFYNMFLPANVGGDVLRAYSIRKTFPHALDSYVVVLVERVLGLVGLVLLSGIGLVIAGGSARWFGVAALVSGGVVFAATAMSSAILERLVPLLPTRFRPELPPFGKPAGRGAFVRALAWSFVSQSIAFAAVDVLLSSVHPSLSFWSSLEAVPLALLSLYVPISTAGLGVREAAFVVVLGKVGVPPASAAAASLSLMAAMAVVAITGAFAHLAKPLRSAEESPRA
jgi:uncharacterized membrane protein YbhN (UPF0104 family)